jgi:hypothetical protein
MVQLLHAFTS